MTTQILCFKDSWTLAQNLAEILKSPCELVKTHRFPDGETKVTLPPIRAEKLLILRSLNQPNDKLIDLLLTAQTARQLGAKELTLIAPYLCYMRQDIAFIAGEAISQKIIGQFLAQLFDHVISVDAHLHRVDSLDQAIPARTALNLTAAEKIGEFICSRLENPVLIGPDSESEQWVKAAAASHGLDYLVARKVRRGDRDVHVELEEFAATARNIVILDDMASTGETIRQTALVLKSRKAESIYCAVTHALFQTNALTQFNSAGIKQVWSCNSIEHPSNAIDLAPLLARSYLSI